MLKKLLGVILAAAMVLSLFPATAFASGEVAENANVKIVYGTWAVGNGEYYNNITLNNYPKDSYVSTGYELSNGFYRYAGCETADNANFNKAPTATSSSLYLQIFSQVGQWKAIAFYVPVAGTYDVTLTVNEGAKRCSFVYDILPGGMTDAQITEAMSDSNWNASNNTATGVLGGMKGNRANSSGNPINRSASHTGIEFEQGEYILVFQNAARADDLTESDNAESYDYINFVSLALQNNGGSVSVPMGYTKLKSNSIEQGKTTTASVSDLYGSGDWVKTTYTSDQITYSSSNSAVATVAADGTVTGKGAGTAEIYAVVDGTPIVSAPITVTAPEIKIVYDISNVYGRPSGLVTGETDYYNNVSDAFVGTSGTKLALPWNFADYTKSNGLWRYIANTTYETPETFFGMWRTSVSEVGQWLAIGFNVPVAGTYDFEFQGYQGHATNMNNGYGCDVAYQIFPAGTTADEIETAMGNVAYNQNETDVTGDILGWRKGFVSGCPANLHENVPFSEAGEYILVIKSLKEGTNKNVYIDHFTLTQSDKTGILPMGYTKLSSNKIVVDSTTQATISDKLYNANDWMEYDASNRTITYASSNSDVATVSANGTVTAKAVGTAEITAIVDGAQLAPATITVEEKKISLAIANSVDSDIAVEAYKAGSVTVNAPTKNGYTFSHWVRGTADKGVWVSSDGSYTFNLVSPTYLTAIYVADDAKIVEFFNGNGELLAQKTVKDDGTVETPVDPSMVGFTFLKWILGKNGNEAIPFVNENIAKSLRVVADYAVESTKYTVGDDTDLVYDAEVVKNADSEDTVWYRGGKPVGYGKTYTYNVWSDTTITSESLTGEKTPLVYLDTAVKTVGDEKACMIEFDGAGKEIVEVGILFSNSGIPEVGSCQYKATSRTNGGDDGHGQFTAKPANSTQAVARGYLIYNENGEYKTVYSEVLSLS